jgi:hypothetical protein
MTTQNSPDASCREHVLKLLEGRQAHVDFASAVAKLPLELQGRTPPGAAHSPWQILEHMRIAQWDILEFSRNAEHVSPEWPDGYWPRDPAPAEEGAWAQSVERFRSGLEAMKKLVADPSTDLYAPIPHGSGQTILREALLLADHNAYHLGELVVVRRLLSAWGGA